MEKIVMMNGKKYAVSIKPDSQDEGCAYFTVYKNKNKHSAFQVPLIYRYIHLKEFNYSYIEATKVILNKYLMPEKDEKITEFKEWDGIIDE